jgi:hypothetical protein
MPSALKIGAGARSERRSEWESGFAGKLAGSGFGEYAVITRLEEFGQPNGILHSFHVHASGKTEAAPVHQRGAHADLAVALNLGPQTCVVQGIVFQQLDRSYNGRYGASASGQRGISVLKNPFEGFDVRSVTFPIHGFGPSAAVHEEYGNPHKGKPP